MSTDVISQPSISHRGRRISLLVVLAIAVAVAVAGAVVVARSSGGTSGEHARAEPPPIVSAQTSPECSVNLDYLAAEVATMPESVRLGVIAGLSPRVRQLTERAMDNQTATGAAALQYGFVVQPAGGRRSDARAGHRHDSGCRCPRHRERVVAGTTR